MHYGLDDFDVDILRDEVFLNVYSQQTSKTFFFSEAAVFHVELVTCINAKHTLSKSLAALTGYRVNQKGFICSFAPEEASGGAVLRVVVGYGSTS